MSTDFIIFRDKVKQKLDELMKNNTVLYRVQPSEKLSKLYLKSISEEYDPIFLTNTKHDCSCCKSFIDGVGNIVSILDDNTIDTIWNISLDDLPKPYDEVCEQLHKQVSVCFIEGIFTTKHRMYGKEQNTGLNTNGSLKGFFDHLYVIVDNKFINNSGNNDKKDKHIKCYSNLKKIVNLYKYELQRIDTALQLIEDRKLNRGNEFKEGILKFKHLLEQINSVKGDNLLINRLLHKNAYLGYIKNSVIGNLLENLTKDKTLTQVINSWNTMTSAANYKRTDTSNVTESQIDAALKLITENGYGPSLNRRFATNKDISVSNVLFVNTPTKSIMKDSLKELLLESVKPKNKPITIKEEYSWEDFEKNLLPKCNSIRLYAESKLFNNLMTLTTSIDPDSKKIFKWDNHFSWSYRGNYTDSIVEKVKKAGGNIDCKLRVSLSWFNKDDLDLHLYYKNNHVYYAQKNDILDVDMNAYTDLTDTPVENMALKSLEKGCSYNFKVNNYMCRSNTNVGFILQVAYDNMIIGNYVYNKKAVKTLDCLTIKYSNENTIEVVINDPDLKLSESTENKTVWGIKNNTFVEVSSIMNSPNYWDNNKVGNNHVLFIIDECINTEKTRSIYNEYLSSEFNELKRPFDLIGEKLLIDPTEDQLSGFGFSKSREDSVVLTVKGEGFNTLVKVIF